MAAIPVDVVASYAYADGDVVRALLKIPQTDGLGTGETVIRLRNGDRRFRGQATVTAVDDGMTLDVSVPRRRLGGQVWQLAVRPEEEQPFVRLQARLLARRGQPVALLVGPVPRTRLPAPEPRTDTLSRGRDLAVRAVGKARRVAGRARRAARERKSGGR